MTAGTDATGAIYDIGYRRYDGPRLGRGGAIGAVVQAGLRAVFGLGRSGRSKIIPWGVVVLAILPAIVAVAVRVLAGEIIPDLYSYENYLWQIGGLFGIFIAAQAPELVVNDIRYRVLPLYFSRPMSRLRLRRLQARRALDRAPRADPRAGPAPVHRARARDR